LPFGKPRVKWKRKYSDTTLRSFCRRFVYLNLGSPFCKYSHQVIDCIPVYVYNTAMYSVKEAAHELGLDTSQVRRLLAKGEIKGVKLARDWIVLDLSYKRKRRPKKR
jgi:excisionase family DNA binding protein